MTLITVGRSEIPRAPPEFQDEVELYARESGRHARLMFVPTNWKEGVIAAGTWVVRFTLRPSDKRLESYQQGRTTEATEDVWIHLPAEGNSYKPLNIQQMGSGGLRRFLEKGNMWSGRGQFKSLEQQLEHTRTANNEAREKTRRDARENSVKRVAEKRRWYQKIPLIPVLINLRKEA